MFQKKFVTLIGGPDVKNFIKRVLYRIFTNKLASECSWMGINGKIKIKNLTIIKIMKGNYNNLIN